LAHSSDTPENGSSPCDRCLTTPPPYDRIHAAYRYEGGIQRLIVGAKFHGCLANTRLLGHLLANSLELDHLSHVDLILAVPGNRAIFRQRGYNQALEIAKEVSKITRIPLLLKGCTKTRTTRKQAELSAIDRRFNLQNAFSVNPAVIQGRNVAIIDDVMTTGSTLAEIARTLKSAGASSVSGWVCARVF
jgi:ComF family protein